ncbi:MAG: extracellular solute-binding protein [Chloroflexales bacterium]|nr:extracellular solute-binding protein [Chloroflexales bacterium]
MGFFRHFAILIAISAAISGCAAGDPAPPPQSVPPPAAADNRVTISFAAPAFARERYAAIIAAFNAENPDFQVRFVALGASQNIQQTVQTADTAAVSLVGSTDAARGLVYDLSPLIDADPTFDRADFYPGAIAAFRHDDTIFALPRTLRIPLLAYNKAMWAAQGLAAPAPDWTWNDLLSAAEQFAQGPNAGEEVYGLWDGQNGLHALAGELASADPQFFMTAAHDRRLDQPAVISALEQVIANANAGVFYLPPPSMDEPVDGTSAQQLIRDGRIGIWASHLLPGESGDTQRSFEIGTAALPESLQAALLGRAAYIMSSGTQHPQEAWRWLAYLSRNEAPTFAPASLAAVDEIPARQSITVQIDYWAHLDAETAAAMQTTLDRPAADQPLFSASHADLLRQALDTSRSNGEAAETTLRAAQAQLEQQRSQAAQATSTPEPMPIVVATAPPIVSAPVGATTITFQIMTGPSEDQIRRVVDGFNQQNLGIFVQVPPLDRSRPPQLTSLAADYDCFAWENAPQQHEMTATLDLQPLIDADAGFSLDDYPAAFLMPFQHEAGLYGLPYAITLRVLIYNPPAFDAAQLVYPTAQWTLDEFLNAAEQLTTGAGATKQYGYAARNSMTRDLIFFLDRFNASPTRGAAATEEPNFTDPKMAQAIRFYLDLLQNYSPHEQLTGYRRGEIIDEHVHQLIREGRIGMMFDYSASSLRTLGFTPAVAAPPFGTSSATAHDFQTNGLYISAATQHPLACWTWLKYLSGDVSGLGNQFPARLSLAESELFTSRNASGTADAYRGYLDVLARTPQAGNTAAPFYRTEIDYFWFFRAIDRALHGADLEQELADAQLLTQRFVDCIRAGTDGPSCAALVDPTYNGRRNPAPE